MRTYHKLIAAAAVAATATAVAVVPAIADPPGHKVPRPQDITGVGSDTIQNVFDQFSVDYNHSLKTAAAPRLYSWDAVNPKTGAIGDTIQDKSGSKNCKNVRPNGSSGGIDAAAGGALALNANTKDPAKGGTGFCTDFARSSRPASQPADGNVTFVPFALDAVTYATNAGSNAPANLSTAQLVKIYTCKVHTWNQVGGKSTKTIVAQLPQTASGTRKFFLTALGGGTTPITPGPCVNNRPGENNPPPNGSFPEENEGVNKFLKGPNVIFPYSVADYIAQVFHSAKCLNTACTPVNGVICKPKAGQDAFGCDVHGRLQLRDINKTAPTVIVGKRVQLNPKFTQLFRRFVFVVVRTKTGHPGNVPAYLQKLFGPKGWVLTNKTAAGDICNYGFGPLPPRKC